MVVGKQYDIFTKMNVYVFLQILYFALIFEPGKFLVTHF